MKLVGLTGAARPACRRRQALGRSAVHHPTQSAPSAGGIACGKSSVTRLLRMHGITVIDADNLAREVCAKVRQA